MTSENTRQAYRVNPFIPGCINDTSIPHVLSEDLQVENLVGNGFGSMNGRSGG
jgi:hypothetical protein